MQRGCPGGRLGDLCPRRGGKRCVEFEAYWLAPTFPVPRESAECASHLTKNPIPKSRVHLGVFFVGTHIEVVATLVMNQLV